MLKRIIKETETLSDQYSFVDMIEEYENNRTTYKLYVNRITFSLKENYPFVAPAIDIRNQSYFTFMRIPNSKRIPKKLKFITGNDCLCCNSILCDWNPSYRIEKLMNEIHHVNLIKRQIKYWLLLDEICDQYNIPISDYIIEFLR